MQIWSWDVKACYSTCWKFLPLYNGDNNNISWASEIGYIYAEVQILGFY